MSSKKSSIGFQISLYLIIGIFILGIILFRNGLDFSNKNDNPHRPGLEQTQQQSKERKRVEEPENEVAIMKARVNTEEHPLRLRRTPEIKRDNIKAKIPRYEEVVLISCGHGSDIIDGKRGEWCLVNYLGEKGFVFDAYLIKYEN